MHGSIHSVENDLAAQFTRTHAHPPYAQVTREATAPRSLFPSGPHLIESPDIGNPELPVLLRELEECKARKLDGFIP